MKLLTNVTTAKEMMQWFANDWQEVERFIKRNNLDGIELMLKELTNLHRIPAESVVGVHLKFWPLWLDFWRGNKASLLKQFGNSNDVELFYGGQDRQALVDYYKREFAAARELKAEYVVFHVAHVELLHTYTGEFTYSDWDVLEATIELMNEAFGSGDQGVTILFENLWWPGLTLTDVDLTRKFFERIKYPNKGFMLDTGHLMATNPSLQTEAEACEYILSKVRMLGELKKYIKGVHLSKSLAGTYILTNHSANIKKLNNVDSFWEKIDLVKPHISKIDQHVPFEEPLIKQVIAEINPDYLVFELLAPNLKVLENMLAVQHKAFE